jgi:hypothetical protein
VRIWISMRAFGAEHRRVQRLVAVGLGQCDVVLEAAGHRTGTRVDDAERRVAVGDGLDDDAERHDVESCSNSTFLRCILRQIE